MLSTMHLRRQVKAKCDVPQVATKTYARFKMGNTSHNAMLKQTEHWSDLGAAYFVHAESFIICSMCAATCGTVDALTKGRPPILQRLKLQYSTKLCTALCGSKRAAEHNESTLPTPAQGAGGNAQADCGEPAGRPAGGTVRALERHLAARLSTGWCSQRGYLDGAGVHTNSNSRKQVHLGAKHSA